jgi:hypothetical protein
MKLVGFISIAALFLSAIVIPVGASPLTARIGDTYEITLTRETAEQGSHGSGSTHDKDTIVERVIGLRSDGLELEYDLPGIVTTAERVSNWQFPARIFKPFHGPAQLLNGHELEARVDRWLKAEKWPRTVCGHWIFTWNTFRIECDPQSVIKTIEAFDLRSADIRDGASYQDIEAVAPGIVTRKGDGADGGTFAVEMPVDPDVVPGEIMKRPVTLEAALLERAKETVSGTISVTFKTDSAGDLRRRTKVTKADINEPDGQSERDTSTETLERQLVARGN